MHAFREKRQENGSEHPVALQVEPEDLEYLEAVEGTLGEWEGEADEGAYREL